MILWRCTFRTVFVGTLQREDTKCCNSRKTLELSYRRGMLACASQRRPRAPVGASGATASALFVASTKAQARPLLLAAQQEVLDCWTNAGEGSALAACKTLASQQAANLFLTPVAPRRRAGLPDFTVPARRSDPAHGWSKQLKRGQLTAPAPSYPKTKLIEDGRRREAHGHHRVGARTRGTAPALITCGGAARDRPDAPPRNRPEL